MSDEVLKPPLLSIRDLVVEGHRNDRWNEILKGISMDLARGEVIGLIGESGAGKSTLGIASMGYTKPGCRIRSGSITFDGGELVGASPEKLRRLRGLRVAYVAQSAAAAFNPAHRLGAQFAEVAVTNGQMTRAEAERRAIEYFRRLKLPDPETIGHRFPHQVSGGQLQRCMVAMAMASNPQLIVFDEPTTALDVTTQVEVLTAIREVIASDDLAAIYITHDLAIVSQIADRIMVMRHGREVETGRVEDVIYHPREDYTRNLLAARKPAPEDAVAQTGTPLISVENVTAAYGSAVVLDDVSLTIERGRTVSVVGESGSGKSTLARVITGLLPPKSGTIRYDGVPCPPTLSGRSKDFLRNLQMIYQMADTALNPRHRIRKIIGRPLKFYSGLRGRALEARILELLGMVELGPDYIDRLPNELSGGEMQRICIARALAADPEIIICDEITSALDQLVAKEILRLLKDLQEKLGVSYLFITHDLETVESISHTVVVMHQGRVVEAGPRADIFAPPFEPYTELLLSSAPKLDPNWLDQTIEKRKNTRLPVA